MQYKVKYGAPMNRPNLQAVMLYVLVGAPTLLGYFVLQVGGGIIGFIIGAVLYAVLAKQSLLIDTDKKVLFINPDSKVGTKKEVNMLEIISMNRNFEWGVGKDIQPSYDIQLITRGDTYVVSFASKKSVQEFEAKFLTGLAEVGNPLS